MRKLIFLLPLFFLGIIFSSSSLAKGKTYYFVVGTGYNPTGSPLPIEENVLDFHSLYSQISQSDSDSLTVLFGSGNNKQKLDVYAKDQELCKDTIITDKELWFEICNKEAGQYGGYLRHNKLEFVDDEASSIYILNHLDLYSELLKEKKESTESLNFRFYYSGHGGKENNIFGNPYNSRMATWRYSEVTASELSKKFDDFPDGVNVQIMMNMCHAAGFANINYEGGAYKEALTKRNRCGFFSSLYSTVSSGASLNLADNESYSEYFFKAYREKNSQGKYAADYNSDGIVGSDEANAYALINQDSLDILVSTSSELLRDIFQPEPKASSTKSNEPFPDYNTFPAQITSNKKSSVEKEIPPRLKMSGWDFFSKRMNRFEIAIVNGIGAKLGYEITKQPHPYIYVDEEMLEKENKKEKSSSDSNYDVAVDYNKLRRAVWDDIYEQFDFSDPYNAPRERVDSAFQAMKIHPETENMRMALKRVKQEYFYNEKVVNRKTLWYRLKYLLETKIYESMLEEKAKSENQTPESDSTHLQHEGKYLLDDRDLPKPIEPEYGSQINFKSYLERYEQLRKCEAEPFFVTN